jgi:membrane-bound lytic murein transglycosylase F
MKKKTEYYVIYNKYFKNPKASLRRIKSVYSTIINNGKISPYDALIQDAADQLGWDWRLLAAQIYQESRFKTDAESWMGAIGLMQIMPATAETFGVENLTDPAESIRAGVTYMVWLNILWEKYIPDVQERVKFILASYNAGQGHVLDARRLARKYGRNPNKWEHVADFLQKKSNPEFYNDPVAYSGYCRGDEPVTYVKDIMNRYQRYKQLVTTPVQEEAPKKALASL